MGQRKSPKGRSKDQADSALKAKKSTLGLPSSMAGVLFYFWPRLNSIDFYFSSCLNSLIAKYGGELMKKIRSLIFPSVESGESDLPLPVIFTVTGLCDMSCCRLLNLCSKVFEKTVSALKVVTRFRVWRYKLTPT